MASVLAVDRDVRFLTERPGLDVLEADITARDFVPGRFGLVHARFVLMHLPKCDRLITAMVNASRPAGCWCSAMRST